MSAALLMDFKGRGLLVKRVTPTTGTEGASSILSVVLVDAQGNPVVLSGSTADVDPPGPYARIVEEVGNDTLYLGESVPGSSTASSAWRIAKIITSSSGITRLYANNSPRFTFKWDLRTTYTYGGL